MTDLTEITNFHRIAPNLLTAGQPTEEQLVLLKDAGCTTVINLALTDSPNALDDEAASVRVLGMDYIHIPVIWDAPQLTDLQAFFSAMERLNASPICVHCVLNMRVSVFVYLYRVLKIGEPLARAYQDILRIWEPELRWQIFMHEALMNSRI